MSPVEPQPPLHARIAQAMGWKAGVIPNTEVPAVFIRGTWTCLPHLSYGQWPPHKKGQTEVQDLFKQTGVEWRGHGFENSLKTASWLYLEKQRYPSALERKIRKAAASSFTVKHGGAELLDSFWEVYARRMHQLGSLPLCKLVSPRPTPSCQLI